MLGFSWSILVTFWIVLASVIMITEGCCALSFFWERFWTIAGYITLVVILPVLWVTGVFTTH